ncbi:MAG: hypothetical protein LC723_02765, partial [Actinobacteria bacterium]|nr:hypothetical protein [Actinomycetota bacterium]
MSRGVHSNLGVDVRRTVTALAACICLVAGALIGPLSSLASAIPVVGPPNDDFANAQTASPGLTYTQANELATTEPSEPTCDNGVRSIWWKFTSTGSSRNTISLSDGDSGGASLAIYTGTSLQDLATVTCQSAAGDATTAYSLDAAAGTTYFIQATTVSTGVTGYPTLTVSGGASMGGNVNDESGTPLAGICIETYSDAYWNYSYSGTDGSWKISGVMPGDYKVVFYDCDSGTYAEQWYNNKSTWATADVVSVAPDQSVGGIDAHLAISGWITGTLTQADGSPVSTCIEAYRQDGSYSGGGYSEGDGTYSMKVGTTGDYKVGFGCYDDKYRNEFYNDKADFGSADLVHVTKGEGTPGVDAVLDEIAEPTNDNIADATMITSLPFHDQLDVRNATKESNEPIPCKGSFNKTVWYTYTPTADKIIALDALGGYSTAEMVYTRSSDGSMHPVNCNNGQGALSQSAFHAVAGQTYYIQAGSSDWYRSNLNVDMDETAGKQDVTLQAQTPC